MHLKHHFYKKYYENFDPRFFESNEQQKHVDSRNEDNFKGINQKIIGYKATQSYLDQWLFKQEQFPALAQFRLQTTYPGLLSGTGYTHETGATGEFKIGFHFDHTSGLPILAGHSVKGCLRSSFPRDTTSKEKQSIKKAKAAYILSILEIDLAPEEQLEWVNALELSIFEAKNKSENKPKRDVFLDAQICAPAPSQRILGTDAITPHAEVWKNPTPLLFLKVLPEVKWQFSFILHDSEIAGKKISAQQKQNLFKQLLLDQGIGAKTNVGYGQFIDPDATKTTTPKFSQTAEYTASGPSAGNSSVPEKKAVSISYCSGKLKVGKIFPADATIEQIENGKTTIKVYLKEDNTPVCELNKDPKTLAIGDIIIVDVQLTKKLKVNIANYKKRKK